MSLCSKSQNSIEEQKNESKDTIYIYTIYCLEKGQLFKKKE